MLRFIVGFLSAFLISFSSYVQAQATATPTSTATPTATSTTGPTPTPTATPDPVACKQVQTCVDTSVPQAITSCAGSNPTCTDQNTDKYGVTAGILAKRALEGKECGKRKRQILCEICYERAAFPLRLRFDTKLFHGMLAQAIAIIRAEKREVCKNIVGSRGVRNRRGG